MRGKTASDGGGWGCEAGRENIQGVWTSELLEICNQIEKVMPEKLINLKLQELRSDISKNQKQIDLELKEISFNDSSVEKTTMKIVCKKDDSANILKEIQKIILNYKGAEVYE